MFCCKVSEYFWNGKGNGGDSLCLSYSARSEKVGKRNRNQCIIYYLTKYNIIDGTSYPRYSQ